MFERVLVANRGEIAVRIIRTLRRMGIQSVAVYSDVDGDAAHVFDADLAVGLGDPRCYLDGAALVAAARRHGADALHPGYGFLSENADFARLCADAGVTFIGPPPEAIEAMGDKINAKRTVAAAGVPVVPGRDEAGLSDAELAEAALTIGLPVLLKPSAGGGGKGMRLVADAADLESQIVAARREATGAFGDDTLLVERYMPRPRHIEMQVFADAFGACVALGERECSLQRRHQKIVEEAPSPLLDEPTRARMSASAVAAALACGYRGAGTVEFIVAADHPEQYFFMEMNTRLQVEHPVTEMVLGVDLVELQLQVAAGGRLPWPTQAEVPARRGHAVEARIYAEDPERGFLPSSGRVLALRQPHQDATVRVDSGLRPGVTIGTTYDPMLAKVIAWAPDRDQALHRLGAALAATSILGVTTNVAFLRRLVGHDAVRSGDIDTGLVERLTEATAPASPPDRVLVVAALLDGHGEPANRGRHGPWQRHDSWRLDGPAPRISRWLHGSQTIAVEVRAGAASAEVSVEGRRYEGCHLDVVAAGQVALVLAGARVTYDWAEEAGHLWIGSCGETWRLAPVRRSLALRAGPHVGGGAVTSPMPGTVLEVAVEPGRRVRAGQRLVVVEAMKMEHSVNAAGDGTVVEVLVRPGDPVNLEQLLVVIEADDDQSQEVQP
ncbi:MAG: acetyl/propionyl-CoA carboxylase subunit alpha [Acidobacteriota bacterium]|nr:acetyl/propionyl-CoA carboxylase subunit alpha [Acidobacteriota bacterium]